ncbi:MAG: hypothetical protein KC433_15240 [Anaerolineales bacterium]|nr:hypothetical protein [Anaerolineales bacterium]MCB8937144.1 hypothetical protein [Ardenticatenaceae bacterium]
MNPLQKIKQTGQSQVEYALLLVLVAGIGVVGLTLLGPQIGDAFSRITNQTPAENEPTTQGEVHEAILVTVMDYNYVGLANVPISVHDAAGQALNITSTTNSKGVASFAELPAGSYTFRGEYQEQIYWSGKLEWQNEWQTVILANKRPFTIQVVDSSSAGIAGVHVTVYTDEDEYLDLSGDTDEDGFVNFQLPEGAFKFRAEYHAAEYWSETTEIPGSNTAFITAQQQGITVFANNGHGAGISGVGVYAFTPNGDYAGVHGETDNTGRVTLYLPPGPYKFRGDHQAREYWSGVVTTANGKEASIEIPEATVRVYVVDDRERPLKNINVYAFTTDGEYIGVHDKTNNSGYVVLILPAGEFKIRADYRGDDYWSRRLETPSQTEITIKIGEDGEDDEDDNDYEDEHEDEDNESNRGNNHNNNRDD